MKKFTFILLSFLTLVQVNLLQAQGENLFNDDIVHEIRLSFSDANFWTTLTANYDENYPDVPYIMTNATIDGEAVDSIGVRLKGFSSYWVQTNKKSIKLDFNEFVSGKKFDGLKKINLNNGEGDPAVQRDKICYDLFRESGVSAPRTAYTKVYLNDDFWGLYVMVEQLDKTFLKKNFGTNDGNLFKNMANSELDWLGTDTTAYQSIFELKTGHQDSAWIRFVHLMDVINNSSDTDFPTAIQEVFDVNLYLKVLAVDVTTGNWDSYLEHGRNFYLYEHPTSKKFKWIPWDYNLAMGGAFSTFGDGGGGGGTTNPEDCLTIQNGSSPYPATDTIFQQVIAQDPVCCNSEWDGICQAIYDDIQSGGNPGGGGGGSNGENSSVTFDVDMSSSSKILIKRLLAVPAFQEQYYQYFCQLLEDNFTTQRLFPMIEADGDLIRDFILADPNYMYPTAYFDQDLDQGNSLIPGLKKYIQEQVTNKNAQLATLYDCGNLVSDLSFNDVVINEFSASSDSLSGVSDSNGEYDDWIELYNNTDSDIDLSNAYLTDDVESPQKWEFPTGSTISAGGYLIVWADKDEGQAGLHAGFKLSKSGEFLMLSINNTVLDSLTFGEQTTNLTASRIPNGTGGFSIIEPTFHANNEGTTATDNFDIEALNVKVYPNPAQNYLTVQLDGQLQQGTKLMLYNTVGQPVLQHLVDDNQTTLSIQDLTPGMYVLVIENEQSRTFHPQKISIY